MCIFSATYRAHTIDDYHSEPPFHITTIQYRFGMLIITERAYNLSHSNTHERLECISPLLLARFHFIRCSQCMLSFCWLLKHGLSLAFDILRILFYGVGFRTSTACSSEPFIRWHLCHTLRFILLNDLTPVVQDVPASQYLGKKGTSASETFMSNDYSKAFQYSIYRYLCLTLTFLTYIPLRTLLSYN